MIRTFPSDSGIGPAYPFLQRLVGSPLIKPCSSWSMKVYGEDGGIASTVRRVISDFQRVGVMKRNFEPNRRVGRSRALRVTLRHLAPGEPEVPVKAANLDVIRRATDVGQSVVIDDINHGDCYVRIVLRYPIQQGLQPA